MFCQFMVSTKRMCLGGWQDTHSRTYRDYSGLPKSRGVLQEYATHSGSRSVNACMFSSRARTSPTRGCGVCEGSHTTDQLFASIGGRFGTPRCFQHLSCAFGKLGICNGRTRQPASLSTIEISMQKSSELRWQCWTSHWKRLELLRRSSEYLE